MKAAPIFVALFLALLSSALIACGDGDSGPPKVEPPPPATLATASGEQNGGAYNYCWKGLCVDMKGVMVPTNALVARLGEPVTFTLLVEPTQVDLLAWAFDAGTVVENYEGFFAWRQRPPGEPTLKYQLSAQPSFQFTPDFPPGKYVVVLSVKASSGSVGYGFQLELAP